ncbi:MAG TPA: metallophosphoesterase [Epsilonproteobacteria bacterium]|nr:metallophosphoesterase [Campylobacterota bacterium]
MSGRIFVCGDTHGMCEDTQKLNGRNFPEQKSLTKNDVLIQLGDFFLATPRERVCERTYMNLEVEASAHLKVVYLEVFAKKPVIKF